MKIPLAILSVLTFPLMLHAQGGTPDSLRVHDSSGSKGEEYPPSISRSQTVVPRIVVRAASISSRVARAPQPTSIVSARELHALGGNDLSDAIARVPGVFVRSYGGLGGLKTLSLRGTSAQQSVVLIDGVRYQGTAAGPLDLGAVPLESFEQIEVMRGGGASLYGANALGGVVNILTQGSSIASHANASVVAGSFGEKGVDVHLSTGSAHDRWSLLLEGRRTDGEYSYPFNEFGETRTATRTNGDAERLFARLGWRCETGDRSEASVMAQGMLSERGVPGGVVQGSIEQTRARLDERELFGVGRYVASVDDWRLTMATTARVNRLRYQDPDLRFDGPQGIDDRYLRSEIGVSIRGQRALSNAAVLNLFVEAGSEWLSGANLDPGSSTSPNRRQGGGGGGFTWFLDEGLLGWETLIEGGARADLFNDVAGSVSPSLGATWRLDDLPVRLRVRGAMSYRVPSFAEQYYLNYGNTDLRPERSVSLDVGGTVDLTTAVVEASWYRIDTRDQIVSTPKSPVSWSARNIAHVRSEGVEIGVSGNALDTLLLFRGSYSLMATRDVTDGPTNGRIVPYAPQELASTLLEVRFGGWSVATSASYVSHRFTLANEDPESALPHYTLVDLRSGYTFSMAQVDLSVRLECRNLFDVEYSVVRNYPMPGRSVRIELGISHQQPP